MMRVYLVQHGKAASAEEDPERGLTAEGRRETESAARFLAEKKISVHEIWRSDKKRSRQTAEILAAALTGKPEILKKDGLSPNDNPEETIHLLDHLKKPVLIAGHLPFLERLAGMLLYPVSDELPVVFRNSGIVCLERFEETGRWRLVWAVIPDIL